MTKQLDAETNLRIAHECKEISDLLVEPQIKLQSSLFDKAKTYTNVILAIGYAGYFAVWSSSKPFLSRRQTIWTAILLLVSLTAYVLFEVVAMFLTSRAMMKRAKGFSAVPVDDLDTPDILARFAALESESNRALLKVLPWWPYVYVVAVGCALIGFGTMLSGLFWHLFHD